MIRLIQSVMNSGIAGAADVASSAGKRNQKTDFGELLKSAINQVNEMQKQSDDKTLALAKGDINDLHNVMISAQKSSIVLETAVQMQRKAIDAYNEIMRMQV